MEEQNNKYGIEERGRFFTILVFLSMMNGFSQVLNGILQLFSKPTMGQDLEEEAQRLAEMTPMLSFREIMDYHQIYFDKFYSISLTNTLLYAGGLLGLFYMYRLEKKGFFLYGFCHILICFVPVLLIISNTYSLGISFTQLLITTAFIAMYASQLKRMK